MIQASPFKLLLSALIVAGVSFSCGKSKAKEPEITESAPVEVIRLTQGGVASELKLPGELIAFQNVDLYAKVSSFVRKLHVDVGSQVREGALLASLEAPEVTAQLSGAESRLKSQEAVFLSSKATYDRLLETSKTPGTVSPNDLDIAFAKQQSDAAMLESARATHREISDNRNYLEIRAPFSGVITARNVSTGAYVGPSGKGSELPIFSLAEQQKLRLVVSVPEAYTGYTNANIPIKFSVRALPGQSFEAKVSRQSGALDSKLRAQRMEMDVPNQSRTLLPGMVAEVSVPLATRDSSVSVPVGAILNSSLGLFVIKITDGKAIWVPVTMGRNDGVNVEIIGNVREGDLVVRHANEEIREMSDVKKVTETTK